MENFYTTRAKRLRGQIEAALSLPIPACKDDLGCEGFFDPWEQVIQGIHGSYSSECDDLMIEALEAVRDMKTFDFIEQRGFAGELILYIFSGHGLTDYGSSPRGGFQEYELKELWQPLIDKWKAYRDVSWSDDEEAA